MLSFLPFSYMFMSTLILSTFMALSSNNYMFIWISLELNLLSFLPIMTMNKSKMETEAAVKYFLAQSLGSGIFLLTSIIIMSMDQPNSKLSFLSFILLSMSIFLKTGVAPLHYWFPQVMSDSCWTSCIILSTWQKIIPLFLMLYLLKFNLIMLSVIILSSAMIGGWGGLMQTQMNTLLAYSSISHMSWIIAILYKSPYTSTIYFIIYAITSLILMFLFSLNNIFSIKQPTSKNKMNLFILIMTTSLLLSLAGMPPFMGFFPKIMSLYFLLEMNNFMFTIILIFGSFMSLSYYLNIIFNMIISKPNIPKTYLNSPFMIQMIPITILTLGTFPLII